MEGKDFVPEIDGYIKRLQSVMDGLDRKQIDDVVSVLLKAYENGFCIYIFGNGGSAATASHFVCDLTKAYVTNWRRNSGSSASATTFPQ